ncbi:MAG: 3'-5' exonuclease, partial [Clostridiales bacterium]|nr:3'-5' exonuclease [Clostridiales bacterium]
MAVLTSPWVFIDLETTGLKPETDKIIEFGLVRYGNDGNRATWGQLVNPGQAMDPFITQLTGIDDAMLSEAPMLSTIRDEAIPLIEGSVVVAHNAAFDVTFLQQQLGIAIQP